MSIHNSSFFRQSAGFTLIELLVVMGIIGILASIMFTNFSSARERARDAKRKSDMAQMKNALRLYYNDYGSYPAQSGATHGSGSGAWNDIQGCGALGKSDCYPVPTAFTAGSTVYMNSLPTDPSYDATADYPNYNYNIGSNSAPSSTDHFILRVYLENASDPSSTTSQQQCGETAPFTPKLYMVCD